ncbi:unnamed protein product [Moneuplotes crassus]|uniref:Uncharacterized protein n=1 Tax=Euplotes crassus TaxID=5936 RepID=A0AAD1U4S2_EUPCR|nr:unnamed protein product [Moneuplotes crassus]
MENKNSKNYVQCELSLEVENNLDPTTYFTLFGSCDSPSLPFDNITEEDLENPLDEILPAKFSPTRNLEKNFKQQEDFCILPQIREMAQYQEGVYQEYLINEDNSTPFNFNLNPKPKVHSPSFKDLIQEKSTKNTTLRLKILLKSSKEKDIKAKRWGKDEDIALFKAFRECEEQGLITLSSICQLKSAAQLKSHQGLQIIKNKLGCRQSSRFIANRLSLKLTDTFSIRETKLLKRLLKNYNYENVKYSEIIGKFSGKTLQGFKNYCDTLCSKKKVKQLTQLNRSD